MRPAIIHIALLLAFVSGLNAQTALYNTGNLRIHSQGQIGFHTNLINDGTIEDNAGLAGFYGSAPLQVSGAFMTTFFDAEILNDAGVDLSTSMNIANNASFVIGDFRTPRIMDAISLNFLQNAFVIGESNASKVDGYATVSNQEMFSFPVGDGTELRSLILNSDGVNTLARCAYFREDPNSPSAFPVFSTELKPRDIEAVSTSEFWRLEGSLPSTVSLRWNLRSNLVQIGQGDVNRVTLMGWGKAANRWLNIGVSSAVGDLTDGGLISLSFVPDDYEVITFGIRAEPEEFLTLDNYIVTPNNDGINDVLEIEELEESPNNRIQIFDRNGLKVFEMTNYRNEFNGVSNVDNMVINREAGLPEGIYFYVIVLKDLNLEYQGFLYLDR
ncbi:gliding motility-associated C-terminal domain-containing protein [Poritiphilus flavus]|uniref:T9SS type B sorting domain-containing protein n=1 Tax=Poritiphilus flavus TaxID=2697053 RepID=A0A6L9EI06_9FLAO|nr:gliding motility-associated C-terminal domain-containing protein [Poritiphilus flavus]NAS14118.1 T9SS type B sorting domain-containing protein [Poritiphilus flavus]